MEIRYKLHLLREWLWTLILSLIGVVRDSHGDPLRIGNRVRVLCEEHDGEGHLPAASYGPLNPCRHSGESPFVNRIRLNFALPGSWFRVHLKIEGFYECWVSPENIYKAAGQLVDSHV